eukprot:GFUD01062572.1.p1 GENE.GFUD01062572.1~~GFUD01062572.1.p1  ORF type:complete len:158 (+),score=46.64 GFUD01062572.1:32-475(+)
MRCLFSLSLLLATAQCVPVPDCLVDCSPVTCPDGSRPPKPPGQCCPDLSMCDDIEDIEDIEDSENSEDIEDSEDSPQQCGCKCATCAPAAGWIVDCMEDPVTGELYCIPTAVVPTTLVPTTLVPTTLVPTTIVPTTPYLPYDEDIKK